MLSPEGRCFTFDQRANGFVPSEGVGVVLLKRLEDAVRDNDQIHGVIQGWGVNQDGKTNGITAPNGDSQTRLEKDVYDKYSMNPEDIQLIETHGTGTKLGDPIEVEALKTSFRHYTKKKNYCALGALKSNVGHLLAATGVAGVIKILLSLKHKKLPPTINYDTLNEHIQLKDSPFYVNTTCKDWDISEAQKRRAAISSFGFSGTNAHMVIEEYLDESKVQGPKSKVPVDRPALIVLSAKNEDRLRVYAKNLIDYVHPSTLDLRPLTPRLQDVAYTLQVGREAMEERLGLIVKSIDELLKKLEGFLANQGDVENLYRGQIKRKNRTLAIFTADEKLQEIIDKWVQRGKFSKLLDLWVNGLAFDWNKLYGEDQPQRISLPTYPFTRERYWASGDVLSPSHQTHQLNNGTSNDQSNDEVGFDMNLYEEALDQIEKNKISISEALQLTE